MTNTTRDLLALSYGMDVESIAVLVGWWRRGIRPHWIGYAEASDKWPDTYVYRPIIDEWLAAVGFPTITDVHTLSSQRAIGGDSRLGSESAGPWSWIYPLREWGWKRDRCLAEMAKVGLPVPRALEHGKAA